MVTIHNTPQKLSSRRINFASTKPAIEYPDFLDVQLKSFQDFFQLETTSDNREKEGLYRVFTENFPITDSRNNFVLEFIDYFIDPPRYSIRECIERGLTYSVPLKAKLKLYCTDPEHEDFETIVQDVYLGMIPYMTHKGTFVINGAERVIVSQLPPRPIHCQHPTDSPQYTVHSLAPRLNIHNANNPAQDPQYNAILVNCLFIFE